MYTAAEIRNIEFTKSMGGYKATEVDAFVDNCADTVEKLTAEKEELNKKLSILADKLVEYRRDEDSIRSALLSAQRMGDSIVREAKEQSESMLADARAQADEIIGAAKRDIVVYEDILARAKNDVSEFKAALLTLYKDHLAMLKNIPDVGEEVKASEEAPVVVAEQPQPVVAPVEEVVAPVQEEVVVDVPAAESTAPKSKFANLKFGEDYSLANDQDD